MLTGSSNLQAQYLNKVTEPKFKIELSSGYFSYLIGASVGFMSTDYESRYSAIDFKGKQIFYKHTLLYSDLNIETLQVSGLSMNYLSSFAIGTSPLFEYAGQFFSTGETLLFSWISGATQTAIKRLCSSNGTSWYGETVLYNSGGSMIYGFVQTGESKFYILEQISQGEYNADDSSYSNVVCNLNRYNLTGSTLVLRNHILPIGSPREYNISGISWQNLDRLYLWGGGSQSSKKPTETFSIKYLEVSKRNTVLLKNNFIEQQANPYKFDHISIGKSMYFWSICPYRYFIGTYYTTSNNAKDWTFTKNLGKFFPNNYQGYADVQTVHSMAFVAGSSGSNFEFMFLKPSSGSNFIHVVTNQNEHIDITGNVINYSNDSNDRISLTLGNIQ